MNLDQLLKRPSPYQGLDLSDCPTGLKWGYGSADPILGRVIRELRPQTIIEIGSYEGGSATYMGRAVQDAGLEASIICIDTWLGSPEHLLQDGFADALHARNGYPRLYYRFLGNMKMAGLENIVTPLPNTSENGAVILTALGIKAQLIFIDAAHEYSPVLRDLEDYWPILADEGVIVGDDYHPSWPGVMQAAHDFARAHSLSLFGKQGKFVLQKGGVLDAKTLAEEGCSVVNLD